MFLTKILLLLLFLFVMRTCRSSKGMCWLHCFTEVRPVGKTLAKRNQWLEGHSDLATGSITHLCRNPSRASSFTHLEVKWSLKAITLSVHHCALERLADFGVRFGVIHTSVTRHECCLPSHSNLLSAGEAALPHSWRFGPSSSPFQVGRLWAHPASTCTLAEEW